MAEPGASTAPVEGECDPRFEAVREAFAANFAERGELGASVCVIVDGRVVADLWGGVAHPESGAPWQRDTVSLTFSCTKAAVALCAHHLAERGLLELEAPVSRYWPEFAQAGKGEVTVQMLLDHAAGLPALREPVKPDGFLDWDHVVDRLAAEPPFWEPGTRNGYHMITFGWTVGEVVRRVGGQRLGAYLREHLTGPADADYWIGLPASELARVAPIVLPERETTPMTDFTRTVLEDRDSIPARAWLNTGGYLAGGNQTPGALQAEIGGAGGVGNARGLARLFTPLAAPGSGGRAPFGPERIARMAETSVATHRDATLLLPTRFASGFMKSMDNRHRPFGDIESVVLGQGAFGHVGAGGSLVFADPACRLAFGYTMNRMGHGILLNERGQSLVDATYLALGYRTDRPGMWVP